MLPGASFPLHLSQVRSKLQKGKYKDDREKSDLERLVGCADAAEELMNKEKSDTLPWGQLQKSVGNLVLRSFKIPAAIARSLTVRFACDLFRAGKYNDWMAAVWPHSLGGGTTPTKAAQLSDGGEEKDSGDESCDNEKSAGSYDEEDGLPYLPASEYWDMVAPEVKSLLHKAGNTEDMNDLLTKVFEALFNTHFYSIVRQCDKWALQKIVDAYMEHVSAFQAESSLAEALLAATNFMLCLCSLVFPQPGRHGCTSDHVSLFIHIRGKMQKKHALAHMFRIYKGANCFVEEILVAPVYQNLVTEYKKVAGAEAGKGKEMNKLLEIMTEEFESLKTSKSSSADVSGPEQMETVEQHRRKIFEHLATYSESISSFREKLRNGATKDLDDKVESIITWLAPTPSSPSSCTVAVLEVLRDLAKSIGNEAQAASFSDRPLQMAEASQAGRLLAAMKPDVMDRPAVSEMLAALKVTENMDSVEGVKGCILQSLENLLATLVPMLASGTVTIDQISPWRDVLLHWSRGKCLAKVLSVTPAKLKTSATNFVSLVIKVVNVRVKCKSYSDASRNGDFMGKKTCLMALRGRPQNFRKRS